MARLTINSTFQPPSNWLCAVFAKGSRALSPHFSIARLFSASIFVVRQCGLSAEQRLSVDEKKQRHFAPALYARHHRGASCLTLTVVEATRGVRAPGPDPSAGDAPRAPKSFELFFAGLACFARHLRGLPPDSAFPQAELLVGLPCVQSRAPPRRNDGSMIDVTARPSEWHAAIEAGDKKSRMLFSFRRYLGCLLLALAQVLGGARHRRDRTAFRPCLGGSRGVDRPGPRAS